MVDGSGVIKTSYAYTPYGATTASGATSTNAVQYAGRENDANGLYYYRARYYNPTYGRFISEDPLGLAAGSNLYRYAADDPVDQNDPSGMILPIVTYLAAGCVAGAALSVVYDVATAVGNWFDGLFGAPTFAHRKITLGSALGDAALGCALSAASLGLGELVSIIRDVRAPELPAGEVPAPEGSSVASRIASGHAFSKHLAEFPELAGNPSQGAFARLIDSAMSDAQSSGMVRSLTNGRVAYWSSKLQMVVISDPASVDGGSAFRPVDGVTYFYGLK